LRFAGSFSLAKQIIHAGTRVFVLPVTHQLEASAFSYGDEFLRSRVERYSGAREVEQLLTQGGIVSVQVLDEFARVALTKMKMPWSDVREALQVIQILCPEPLPITLTTHQGALMIAEKYRFGIFDALIVASALEANCPILYSEDMRDGQVIDRRLTIKNPFSLTSSSRFRSE
jgi:predicted nucleic acid-binding protein